ncbi:MAG: ParB N-terminal domain-containing protein [Treponemataceae bacterium]|nr:MAG: ParB N-terminal domain-containing protein [Treponemataceae bacterium]
MQVKVSEICVKKRVRKDIGNLEQLKNSLHRYGLLNPITLNKNYELIAGERRFEAAKQLGWTSINAVVLDTDDELVELELELEENTQRLDFANQDLLAGFTHLEKLRHPGFFLKIWLAIKKIFKKLFASKKSSRKSK